jgi:hypothetical protein
MLSRNAEGHEVLKTMKSDGAPDQVKVCAMSHWPYEALAKDQ